MGSGKIFVLFAVRNGTPIGDIRKNFLVDVLKRSAAGLNRHSRSDAHNIAGFNPDDERRGIRIHQEDWPFIAGNVDETLETESFQNSNGIEKLLFYSAVHGMQNTRGEKLGDAAVKHIQRRLQVDITSPKILLITVDVSVNINSRDREALLVDASCLKQVLQCNEIRQPMTLAQYNKYNVVGVSQFT